MSLSWRGDDDGAYASPRRGPKGTIARAAAGEDPRAGTRRLARSTAAVTRLPAPRSCSSSPEADAAPVHERTILSCCCERRAPPQSPRYMTRCDRTARGPRRARRTSSTAVRRCAAGCLASDELAAADVESRALVERGALVTAEIPGQRRPFADSADRVPASPGSTGSARRNGHASLSARGSAPRRTRPRNGARGSRAARCCRDRERQHQYEAMGSAGTKRHPAHGGRRARTDVTLRSPRVRGPTTSAEAMIASTSCRPCRRPQSRRFGRRAGEGHPVDDPRPRVARPGALD